MFAWPEPICAGSSACSIRSTTPAAAQDFWPIAIRALTDVVPYDICAYNEVNLRRRAYSYLVEPQSATFPDCQSVFAAYMHQLPFFTQAKRLRKALPTRFPISSAFGNFRIAASTPSSIGIFARAGSSSDTSHAILKSIP